MNVSEAWEMLGESWTSIALILSSAKVSDRAKIIDDLFIKARKLARISLAKYHPDINKTPGAIKRFQSIQEALKLIEGETENFKLKLKMKQSEPKKPRDKIVF